MLHVAVRSKFCANAAMDFYFEETDTRRYHFQPRATIVTNLQYDITKKTNKQTKKTSNTHWRHAIILGQNFDLSNF